MTPINSLLYMQWLHLKPTMTPYCAIVVCYWIFALFGLFSMEMAVATSQMVVILSPLALFSREKTSIDYIRLLPMEKKTEVTGRYSFALLLILCSTTISLALLSLWQVIWNKNLFSSILALLLSTALALLFLSLALPLLYSVGVSSGKPWFFLMILLPVALFTLHIPFFDQLLEENDILQDGLQSLAKMILLLAVTMVFLGISYHVSIKIHQRKA